MRTADQPMKRGDYEKALRSVRAAAYELSRFVEEVYADD